MILKNIKKLKKLLENYDKIMVMIDVKSEARAYSEVYVFINALGDDYKNMISPKLYETIEKNRDLSYTPDFDLSQDITSETFSKEALALIAALNLKFWCKDQDERNRLMRQYQANNEIVRRKEEEKAYEHMFRDLKKEKIEAEQSVQENLSDVTSSSENTNMVVYKENIFTVIIDKIKSFFKNLFRR